MTIEEQIQKSASMASMGITEVEPDPLDEVDDIDKVRDDLQSTKQMLAMELKNKEALERENKKLQTKILNLEVEVEKEKNKTHSGATVDNNELLKVSNSLILINKYSGKIVSHKHFLNFAGNESFKRRGRQSQKNCRRYGN